MQDTITEIIITLKLLTQKILLIMVEKNITRLPLHNLSCNFANELNRK